MAEYLFRDALEKRGIAGVECASAALHRDEIGSPVHRKTARLLASLGIDCSEKRARLVTKQDGERFDYILGMDEYNLVDLERTFHGCRAKIGLLGAYADPPIAQIADPWYTGDFEATYRDIAASLPGLLKALDLND